jgi:hypothetical protein
VIRRTVPLLLGAVAVIGLATACSSPTAGSPLPSASTTSDPADVAPKVAHPLDPSAVISKPCTALSVGDLAAIGLAGARTEDNSSPVGQGCAFFVGETGVNIEWVLSNTNGLADIYYLKPRMAYWIPMAISGYPAVEAASVDGRSNIGDCLVNVGVNDQKYFFAEGEVDRNADQSCALAKNAAAAVIKNLQGGG